MTFSLTGFATVVRDGVELPANFAATINADMKVGSLEETITVTGETPLVDVTQAARTSVVTRDMLDTLPTTRHVFSVSNMLPGIRFATPDIGGSRQMEQTNPRGHGVNGAQAQEAIDGMSTSSQESNIVWTYVNDSLVQEVTVTTAAHPAEVQGAAMRMNNRTWKRKGKDYGAGSDPRAGSYRDPRTGKYAVGQAKYTIPTSSGWAIGKLPPQFRTSCSRDVATILQGRLTRLAFQMKF